MISLNNEGRRFVETMAAQHELSPEAIITLMSSLSVWGGCQADFDHPELGGRGAWSRGGIVVIGEAYNETLKSRVNAICRELSRNWSALITDFQANAI